MAQALATPELGIPAPQFDLPATDGNTYSLAKIMGEKGAVVVFICNHCPYVKAITDRLVSTAATLQAEGYGFAAICSNDAVSHPGDSFENMAAFATEKGFNFPYLWDESQDVARAYDAQCTPDFYGLNAEGLIQYRGRLDEGRNKQLVEGAKADLLDAMRMIGETGKGPQEQFNSVGCGIKWKAA